jgi:hypothetical protein
MSAPKERQAASEPLRLETSLRTPPKTLVSTKPAMISVLQFVTRRSNPDEQAGIPVHVDATTTQFGRAS